MDKVYLVKVRFIDWDESWYKIIGTFTDEISANKYKNKWVSFFNSSKSIFDKPHGYDDESWEESEEYNTLFIKYGELMCFDKITIDEISIDVDLFTTNTVESPMHDLIKEFDRDFKINDLL